ncbi:MAG TPA: amidohydrolase, partial [Nordella sp.]|nr:amidohydrolase [Nordella sp.]
MIVDSHQHFWAPARGDYDWMGTGDALKPLRRDFH